jgi:inorganic pyrophosphatase
MKIPLQGEEKNAIHCIVETPRGSCAKLKFDPETKLFMLSKELVTGLSYPYDWGFIPSTLGEDGDPTDVMLLHDVTTYPGLLVNAIVVGVLEINDCKHDDKTPNPRIFAVPVGANRENEIEDVRQLSKRTRKELEKFFKQTAALESKEVEVIGWEGPKRAQEIVAQSAARFHGQQ